MSSTASLPRAREVACESVGVPRPARDQTTPHEQPDSVMYTVSSFQRRLSTDDDHRDVELHVGTTGWLPAHRHSGHNIGDTPSHAIFVELKEAGGAWGGTCAGTRRPVGSPQSALPTSTGRSTTQPNG